MSPSVPKCLTAGDSPTGNFQWALSSMSGFTDVWASIGHRLASPDNGRLARHAVTWEDRVVPGAFEVQNPEFVIDRDGRTLMILVDDGKRLATLLELRPADADANSAALKIGKRCRRVAQRRLNSQSAKTKPSYPRWRNYNGPATSVNVSRISFSP
jgi:hypothetical protein